MENTKRGFVYWTPRILSIIFILFMALMSLDVFSPELSFGETLLALFMHNIPAMILLAVLIIAWKREIVGGVAFILGGFVYIALLMRNPFEWFYLVWIAQISGISFLIGWRRKKKLQLHV